MVDVGDQLGDVFGSEGLAALEDALGVLYHQEAAIEESVDLLNEHLNLRKLTLNHSLYEI